MNLILFISFFVAIAVIVMLAMVLRHKSWDWGKDIAKNGLGAQNMMTVGKRWFCGTYEQIQFVQGRCLKHFRIFGYESPLAIITKYSIGTFATNDE